MKHAYAIRLLRCGHAETEIVEATSANEAKQLALLITEAKHGKGFSVSTCNVLN